MCIFYHRWNLFLKTRCRRARITAFYFTVVSLFWIPAHHQTPCKFFETHHISCDSVKRLKTINYSWHLRRTRHQYLLFAELNQRILKSGMVRTLESGEATLNMSQKMFIIMPESCETPTDIHQIVPTMKFYSWIPFKASRAGIKQRDYKAPVYSLEDPDTDTVNAF